MVERGGGKKWGGDAEVPLHIYISRLIGVEDLPPLLLILALLGLLLQPLVGGVVPLDLVQLACALALPGWSKAERR